MAFLVPCPSYVCQPGAVTILRLRSTACAAGPDPTRAAVAAVPSPAAAGTPDRPELT